MGTLQGGRPSPAGLCSPTLAHLGALPREAIPGSGRMGLRWTSLKGPVRDKAAHCPQTGDPWVSLGVFVCGPELGAE